MMERAREQALGACARAIVVNLQVLERVDDGARQASEFLMKERCPVAETEREPRSARQRRALRGGQRRFAIVGVKVQWPAPGGQVFRGMGRRRTRHDRTSASCWTRHMWREFIVVASLDDSSRPLTWMYCKVLASERCPANAAIS